MPDLTPVTSISNLFTEVAKIIGEWQKTSVARRMRAAIECGEKYIQVNERSGEYSTISDQRRLQLLGYYRKKFFKYNN